MGLQQGGGRHQHARRAIAALQSGAAQKALLQRMQLTLVRQPLDGLHPFALRHDGQTQTGFHRQAVNQHGAGTANPGLATALGASQMQVVAQAIGQQTTRRHHDLNGLAVDFQFKTMFAHSSGPLQFKQFRQRATQLHLDDVTPVVGTAPQIVKWRNRCCCNLGNFID